jgi:hypothetical protein
MKRDHLEDLGVDCRIILKWIFRTDDGEARTGFLWLKIAQVAGACECGNESSGATKCGEFLHCLRSCQLHRRN